MAAHDNQERMWLVHGSTSTLPSDPWTVDSVVENLGHPTAITLGAGGLTPEDALYIATTSGNLDSYGCPNTFLSKLNCANCRTDVFIKTHDSDALDLKPSLPLAVGLTPDNLAPAVISRLC